MLSRFVFVSLFLLAPVHFTHASNETAPKEAVCENPFKQYLHLSCPAPVIAKKQANYQKAVYTFTAGMSFVFLLWYTGVIQEAIDHD